MADIRVGSPAEQVGIKAYDEILSVNTIPTFIWELAEINKLFRSEPGKEIQIEIRRYDDDDPTKWQDFKFTFTLKKQI